MPANEVNNHKSTKLKISTLRTKIITMSLTSQLNKPAPVSILEPASLYVRNFLKKGRQPLIYHFDKMGYNS